jgi:hypothetical protein
MNNGLKLGLLSVAAGLAMHAGNANAAVVMHTFSGNAVNYCQAFTPGPSNTIRNRVVGSENVGPNVMNVACNFASMYNGDEYGSNPVALQVFFSNNKTAPLTVTCTLLTSYQGSETAYVSTKSVTIPALGEPGSQATESLYWSAEDNPAENPTDLGSNLVGINCTLPVGAVINDTYLDWAMDNGI